MSTKPAASGAGSRSFWSATGLVAGREVQAMVRTKSYWILFGMFVVGIFAAAIVPGLFGGGVTTVATLGPHAQQLVSDAGLEGVPQDNLAGVHDSVRDGEVAAAVVPDDQAPTGVRVIGLSTEPNQVVLALSESPPVELLDPEKVAEPVRFLVAFAFGLVFLIFGAGFGVGIAQSVVTEKQTRIVEILVATIPVRALLAGKIAGHSLLAFVQIAGLAVIAPLALWMGEERPLLSMVAPALGWFVPFFLFGFVLLAAMWATAGALVSRMEDLGTTTSVVTALVMLPYFAVVFVHDNESVMTILSYVPFSAAVAMPVRLFAGQAQTWEPLVALALLVGAVVVTALAASRIYAGSLLQTSGRVRLSQAWTRAK